MSTKRLEAYLDAAAQVAALKALGARYAAAAAKDASVVVSLTIVINGVAVPATEVAPVNLAIASRIRAQLPALWNAAVAEREAARDALKAAARAEYDQLFGP